MKSLSKTLILSLLATTCSLALATPKVISVEKTKHRMTIKHMSSSHPDYDRYNKFRHLSNKIAYVHESPLLQSSAIKESKASYRNCTTKRKNELVELSAIFNDKLHMFLSYFESDSPYQHIEKSHPNNDLNANNKAAL